MTPATLAKSDTEHAHQVALFAYCAVAMRHGFDIADDWCEKGDGVLRRSNTDFSKLAVPALEWFHAIPNGGSRGDNAKSRAIRGGQLKAEGVRQGVADCFLPYPIGQWHGLYIEMKKPSQRPKKTTSKGGMSDNQIKFKEYVKSLDYGFMTCYSWQHAVTTLRSYIEWKG
jgi:hypothetical protein